MKDISLRLGDTVAIVPTEINSIDDMEVVAAEMKKFALENPHDYKATIEAVENDPELKSEKTESGILKVRGFADITQKYNRYILFKGWEKPYQLTWVHNVTSEGTIQQLTIIDYAHQPLESEMIRCMASFFWDFDNKEEWNSIKQIPGTPIYGAMLARLLEK